MDTSIQKYFAFVNAVKYSSFTKSAEIMNYSQSGISRMINDLESEWGVVLLERGKGGVSLTSDGEKLLPFARSVCSSYNELQIQVDKINGLESGLIRIGTFSSVATHLLPKIIGEFKKDYPNIDYELLLGDYDEIEGYIADGRVDFGFLRLPSKNEFETVFVQQDNFLAVLPEGHPLASNRFVSPAELCGYDFIMLEKGNNKEISEIFTKCSLKPNVRCTLWDDYAIMSMVENGLGVSVLPELILQRVDYNIITRPLSVPAYRNIGIAFREKKALPSAVKKFLEYLYKE